MATTLTIRTDDELRVELQRRAWVEGKTVSQLGILEMATLDRRGFPAHRTRRGEAFIQVLDDQSRDWGS